MLALYRDPLFRDLDRLFWGPSTNHRSREIREDDDAFHITLEVPGYRPEDIEVSFAGHELEIQAKRDGHSIHKAYLLSDIVDIDNIEARTEYGLLMITLPKRASERPRRILVKGSGM